MSFGVTAVLCRQEHANRNEHSKTGLYEADMYKKYVTAD